MLFPHPFFFFVQVRNIIIRNNKRTNVDFIVDQFKLAGMSDAATLGHIQFCLHLGLARLEATRAFKDIKIRMLKIPDEERDPGDTSNQTDLLVKVLEKVCMYVCMYSMYMHVCMYVCIYACTYVCMYVCRAVCT